MSEQANERHLRLDDLAAQVWVLSDPATYGDSNQAHADFLGKDPAAVAGASLREVRPADTDIDSCIQSNRRAFKEAATVTTTEWIPAADGARRAFSVTRTPTIRDGEVTRVVCTATDVTEHTRTEQQLTARVEVERTVAEIASRYAGDTDFDAVTDSALADVGRLLGAGRAYLFQFHEDDERMDNTHEWVADGVTPQQEMLQDLPIDTFPWWMSKLRDGETIHIKNVADLPEAATAERAILSEQDIKSVLVLPVSVDGELAGFVGFDNVEEIGAWSEDARFALRVVSASLGNALEAKRSATALRERDAELEVQSVAMEAAMDGIAILDADGEYVYMNEAHAAMFGYDPEELVGQTWRAIYGPAEAERIETTVFPALDRDGEWRGETVGETRAGDSLPQEITLSALPDGQLICTNRNITDQKRREADLRELTERLDLAIEGANLGVWDWHIETDSVTFNDQWAQLLDLSLDDLDGTIDEWRDRVHPDDIEAVESALQAHLDGDTDRYDSEHRMRTAGGDWVWVRDVGKVVERADDAPVRAVGIHRDITEEKQSQRLLEDERDMFAQGPAVVFKWQDDEDWSVEYVSENVTETLGYTPAELTSGAVPYTSLVHDDDRERVADEVAAATDGTTERFSHEPYRMVTKSGEVRWVRDHTKIVRDDSERTDYLGYLVDITERKRREEELQRIRDRFERFSETVPSAFFLVSADYTETHYVNSSVETVYGISEETAMADPAAWTKHVHPDDLERLQADMRRQRNRAVDWPEEQEFRVRHPERGLRWVRSQIQPIRNEAGEAAEFAGVAIDVTDQKRLERSLRRNEESLRELTTIASDTTRAFDTKLRDILDLGRDYLDLEYGYVTHIAEDHQEIIEATGSHPLLQAGEVTPLSRTYCRQTVEHGGMLDVTAASDEGWEADPAYDHFELETYIGETVEVAGDTYGTLCFAGSTARVDEFDETERAFVELLVQWLGYELTSDAVETKLRALNETAQRLMGTATPSELASVAVESAETVLDFPLSGLWWSDESDSALVAGELTEESATLFSDYRTLEPGDSLAWDVYEDGVAQLYDDLRTVDTGDTTMPVRSAIVVPLGDHGVMISAARDPAAFSETDRRLLEILAATVEAALNRAEREQLLRETRESLEQSNQELEQFAYAASHDLQEPLRTVSSYLTLLERRYGEELDEEAIEFIDFAVDGADRMQEMIQALLEYSRVDTRGGAFEETDISAVFEQVTQNLGATIEETNATVSLPTDAGTVVGDERQLVQLFQNLVENALKYSEGAPQIDISATHRDSVVEYAVADDGIGMDPDQLADIFEVFQRLHTREEFTGTGIGLAIARKIVDRHEGDIRAESTPGEGSTFSVTLPAGGENRA